MRPQVIPGSCRKSPEEGATEAFAEAGIPFRSLYKAGEFLKG